MKFAMMFGGVAIASVLVAGELDEKCIRLIGPPAKFVYGVSLGQYRNSALYEIFPTNASDYLETLGPADSRVYEIVKVEYRQLDQPNSLLILRGAFNPGDFQPNPPQTGAASEAFKGMPVFAINSTLRAALIDPDLAIVGDFSAVAEALARLGHDKDVDSFGSTLRDLSRNYDNWFLARTPLAELSRSAKGESIHAAKLIHALESVQGGIRFGGSSEIRLETTTESPEDALTAAAIGRWLPGFWQLQNKRQPESAVLDLAEDFTINANGKVASLSFRISETRLRELLRSREEHQAAFDVR